MTEAAPRSSDRLSSDDDRLATARAPLAERAARLFERAAAIASELPVGGGGAAAPPPPALVLRRLEGVRAAVRPADADGVDVILRSEVDLDD